MRFFNLSLLTSPRCADLYLLSSSYHEGHLWVIDVSQSIEHEHPAAFDFLRADIKNANDFFSRRGVETLGLQKTFNFVTRDSWIVGREETDEDITIEVERLIAEVEAHEEEEEGSALSKAGGQDETASDEAVFAQSYIPRTLEDVYDPERDVARVLRGEGKGLIYADITGVASIHKTATDTREEQNLPPPVPAGATVGVVEKIEEADEEEGGSSDDDDDDGESGSEDSEGEDGDRERRPKGKKFEDKEEKKVRRFSTFLSLLSFFPY